MSDTFATWILRNGDLSVRTADVTFDGVLRTNKDFLRSVFANTLSSLTLADLYRNSQNDMKLLRDLEIFKESAIIFTEGPEPGTANVTIKGVEQNWYTLLPNRDSSKGESQVFLTASLLNVSGRADNITVRGNGLIQPNHYLGLLLEKPLLTRYGIVQTEIEGVQRFRDWSSDFQQHESIYGGIFRLKAQGFGGQHILSVESNFTEIRNLGPVSLRASTYAGQSLRSSIHQTFHKTNVNTLIYPTTGYTFKIDNELTHTGHGSTFHKHEVSCTKFIPIKDRLALSMSFQAGVLMPSSSSRVFPGDLFFLGGTSTLKGFKKKSVGDRPAGLDGCVGGTVYGCFSTKLYIPVSHSNSFGNLIRGIAFFNAGNSTFQNEASPSVFHRLKDGLRASVGLGFSLQTPLGPLELTYSVPLQTVHGDKMQNIQLGFAL